MNMLSNFLRTGNIDESMVQRLIASNKTALLCPRLGLTQSYFFKVFNLSYSHDFGYEIFRNIFNVKEGKK